MPETPLDPMLAQLVEMGRNAPQAHTLSPAEARAGMRARVAALAPFAPQDTSVETLTIAAPHGELVARSYRGVAGNLPILLFLHGGGWVLGDLDTHDNVCRHLAAHGLLVVSLDYRLAPETPAPGQIDDAMAALRWAADNAAHLGGDPHRIVVGGDSAGGNLAALAAIRARAEGPALAGQLLIYPVTDHPDAGHASYAENEPHGLTGESMRWFWDLWLGGAAVDGTTAPLRADDLSRLPPAYVVTASHDVLRDEAFAFADRLEAAGGAVTRDHVEGAMHGFYSTAGFVPLATDALARTAAWVNALPPTP